jgi:hypothetical protein
MSRPGSQTLSHAGTDSRDNGTSQAGRPAPDQPSGGNGSGGVNGSTGGKGPPGSNTGGPG